MPSSWWNRRRTEDGWPSWGANSTFPSVCPLQRYQKIYAETSKLIGLSIGNRIRQQHPTLVALGNTDTIYSISLIVLMWEYGHTLEDETLRNLLAEAECFINSHPLTVPSSDPKDLDPLTPNHILTMKSRAWMSPPGKAPKRLMRTSKKMETQDFPNVFCSRWRKDRYLKCMANTTALGFGQV